MYQKIIDNIENVRASNNVNWMNILRIAMKNNPIETVKVISKIYESDSDISNLVKLLKNFNSIKKILDIRLYKDEDLLDILEWRNEKVTRKFSKNTKIINKKQHSTWIKNFLSNKDNQLYLVTLNETKVGMIRIDSIKNKNYLISINFNPIYRGLGLSKLSLIKVLKFQKNKKLIADIHKDNFISENVFLSCGFKKSKKLDDKFNRYIKK